MEPVYFGDKIANQSQNLIKFAAARLCPKSAGRARLRPTHQSSVNRIQFYFEGDVWGLPFSRPRIAPQGDASSCGMQDADLGVQVLEETLLRVIYGHTYQSVSCVSEASMPFAEPQLHSPAALPRTAFH